MLNISRNEQVSCSRATGHQLSQLVNKYSLPHIFPGKTLSVRLTGCSGVMSRNLYVIKCN